ncbi:MAG TPA: serine/threonine-protein kinase, partial [Chloroflexota bacterium]|nr:serine/threonine-protein kinase [Chloroflexota bacterium]
MPQVLTDELLGQTLGQGEYRLVARLGAGSMGAVYEAEQASLRRRVAVKVLWPHLTQQPGLADRFNREARIAARLEHPHILPVYGFGQERGLLYLVMRLVRGGSLEDRLRGEGSRRQGWPPLEALELARQALPPLDYAHRQGVIHRDLKPDNILLEPSDEFSSGYRVFLSDFSIARLVQREDAEPGITPTGHAIGTPTYMAPEQVLDQDVDGRADLYAFGVVLFELLVGQVPFHGQTPLSVAMQHVREPIPSPRELNPTLSPALEAVLLRALAKDRDDRFSTGATLLAALSQAVMEVHSKAPTAVAGPTAPRQTVAPRSSDRQPSNSAEQRVETEAPQPLPTSYKPRAPVRARGGAPGRLGSFLVLCIVLLLVAVALFGVWSLVRPSVPSFPPAQPSARLDPRDWAVTAEELGPQWRKARDSTAGSTPQLAVYEVEYANEADNAPRTTGFSLFAAASSDDAKAGLDQLRQQAEGQGVAFESSALLGGDQPSWRGRSSIAGDAPSLSIVHL